MNNEDTITPIYGNRDPLPGERMGLFPYILKRLSDYRAKLKKSLIKLSLLGEKLMKIKNTGEFVDISNDDLIFTVFECSLDKFNINKEIKRNTIYNRINR